MVADTRSAAPAGAADTSEQPTLRVMRLYKPRLDSRRVLPSCSIGDSETATPTAGVSRRGCGVDEGDFALSSALKLPDSFGNIYLGETFTAYIRCVACHRHNERLSSDVKSSSSETAVIDCTENKDTLPPQECGRTSSLNRVGASFVRYSVRYTSTRVDGDVNNAPKLIVLSECALPGVKLSPFISPINAVVLCAKESLVVECVNGCRPIKE